ncbi:MAG: DUF3850 domain-containing protein [Bacteroidota bacterium]
MNGEKHHLKLEASLFLQIKRGGRQLRLRKADCSFHLDDRLKIWNYCFDQETYLSEKPIFAKVTYKLNGGNFGIEEEDCLIGIQVLKTKTFISSHTPPFQHSSIPTLQHLNTRL